MQQTIDIKMSWRNSKLRLQNGKKGSIQNQIWVQRSLQLWKLKNNYLASFFLFFLLFTCFLCVSCLKLLFPFTLFVITLHFKQFESLNKQRSLSINQHHKIILMENLPWHSESSRYHTLFQYFYHFPEHL